MNKTIYSLTEEKYVKDYPISGLLDGWFFRYQEIAPGVFLLEGIDEGGHVVSRICAERDIDAALKACARDAREIEFQLVN